MSDTLRTDEAVRKCDGQWHPFLRDLCEELERENARLKADAGSGTDEPNFAGTLWARVNAWKDRCDELWYDPGTSLVERRAACSEWFKNWKNKPMSEKQTPIVPGVHLPSAEDEATALCYWAAETLPLRTFLNIGPSGLCLYIFLEPKPRSHALVLVVTGRNETLADLPDFIPGWLEDLTLRGYKTAVCAGFLAAQKTVREYLSLT